MHAFKKNDFFPVPNVDTVLLHLNRTPQILCSSDLKDFKDLVAYFYSHGKGDSSKERLSVLFSNAQIKRLCKENNINMSDPFTKITSEQWINIYHYSRIGLTVEKKRLIYDAYIKMEKNNSGLKKQNRTNLRKSSQNNNPKSSTYHRLRKSHRPVE